MKNIIPLLILIALASCRSPQQIADRHCAKAQAKYEKAAYRWGCPLVQQTDSVVNTIVIRETHDTTIYIRIPGEKETDTVTVTIKKGIVQSAELTKDTQYAYAKAQVIDGVLVLHLVQKESVIASTIKDAIQNNSEVKYIRITKTITETTNIITPWQWAQIWIGRILLLLLAMALLLYVLLIARGKYLIL